MKYWVTVQGTVVEVEVNADGVHIDGRLVSAELETKEGTSLATLSIDGNRFRVAAGRGSGGWTVCEGGESTSVTIETERTRLLAAAGGGAEGLRGSGMVRAPMPGLVLRIDVSVGDVVGVGDGLLVLEAMKMENVIRSSVPGKIAKIYVSQGTPVEKAVQLVEIEPSS